MPFVLVGVALLVGYYIASHGGVSAFTPTPAAPKVQSVITVQGSVGSPGGYSGGGGGAALDLRYTSQGVSTLGSVGAGSASGIFGSGAAAAGTTAGTAIPIIGAAIGVVTSIVGAISQHHQAALAAEGRALNDATPRAMQTFALIVQGTANGEITSLEQANQLCVTTVNAWYGEVKPIQRGTWHYTLTPAKDPSIVSADPTPGIMNWFDYNDPTDPKPDPCNGACVMGHYFVERGAAIVMIHVGRILAGQHGVCILPAVPAHETQQGYPQTSISY